MLADLAGIQAVVGSCEEFSKPFAFVLNGTNPDQPGWNRLIKSAVEALKRYGPVLPKTVRERAAYISALNHVLSRHGTVRAQHPQISPESPGAPAQAHA